MVFSCFVIGCNSHSLKEKLSFYRIPSIISKNNKLYSGFGKEKEQEVAIELSKNGRKRG